MKKWKMINWVDINNKVPGLRNQLSYFDKECMRMPEKIKMTNEYKLLKQDIENMKKTMPYIVYLTLPTIKPRHFRKLLILIKAKIALKSEKVQYEINMEDKAQDEIEGKLNNSENQLQDIENYWLQQELSFVNSKMDGVEQELDTQ